MVKHWTGHADGHKLGLSFIEWTRWAAPCVTRHHLHWYPVPWEKLHCGVCLSKTHNLPLLPLPKRKLWSQRERCSIKQMSNNVAKWKSHERWREIGWSENKETEQKVSAVCRSREDARKKVGKLVTVLLFDQCNCTNVNFLSDYYTLIRRDF